ncbi:hypothetical protein OG589_40480 [Sphaerisporangium sp. NBC_01403]|uniref:hypothetical protein n=1 Tax=Sphaerisporangium sp. NBC_01403 TaxID=2903599 RepID=UPI0032561A5F
MPAPSTRCADPRWYTDKELEGYQLVKWDPHDADYQVIVAGERVGWVEPTYGVRGRNGWRDGI